MNGHTASSMSIRVLVVLVKGRNSSSRAKLTDGLILYVVYEQHSGHNNSRWMHENL